MYLSSDDTASQSDTKVQGPADMKHCNAPRDPRLMEMAVRLMNLGMSRASAESRGSSSTVQYSTVLYCIYGVSIVMSVSPTNALQSLSLDLLSKVTTLRRSLPSRGGGLLLQSDKTKKTGEIDVAANLFDQIPLGVRPSPSTPALQPPRPLAVYHR